MRPLTRSLAAAQTTDDTGGVNFLAHLVLAPDTPEGMAGSLAPDLIRGPLPADLAPEVLDAAREHQSIDRATDRHPAFIEVRDRLRPAAGRFAGIVADVMFDHALAHAWAHHGRAEPLLGYTARVGQTLTVHRTLMPATMQDHIARMLRHHWLNTYATPAGMRLTLERMSARYARRLRIEVDLTPAADLIATAPPHWLTAAFASLWPDLQQHVHRRRHAPPHPSNRLA
ncbi:MAG: ACP phosphodiesterase [Phycisphaerales bacterium JB063]